MAKGFARACVWGNKKTRQKCRKKKTLTTTKKKTAAVTPITINTLCSPLVSKITENSSFFCCCFWSLFPFVHWLRFNLILFCFMCLLFFLRLSRYLELNCALLQRYRRKGESFGFFDNFQNSSFFFRLVYVQRACYLLVSERIFSDQFSLSFFCIAISCSVMAIALTNINRFFFYLKSIFKVFGHHKILNKYTCTIFVYVSIRSLE